MGRVNLIGLDCVRSGAFVELCIFDDESKLRLLSDAFLGSA